MTTLGLAILAGASVVITLGVANRLLSPERTWLRVDRRLESLDDESLETQVATLRAMVLQLRLELAQAQRENEQSRVRDLELLRLRGAELLREAEIRAVSSERPRQRGFEPVPQEARQLLAAMGNQPHSNAP